MQQNKYDDPAFFEQYEQMPRSVRGLGAATEWPCFRSLLPDVIGKRVLDLGCGFGWHCRYLRERGAQHVIGVDISDNMLTRARTQTKDAGIEYRYSAIEDLRFAPGQFDLVISSLGLHYVEDFREICGRVFAWLAPSGAFIFSVEHPIFTARQEQDWCVGPLGERLALASGHLFRRGHPHQAMVDR